MNTTLATIGAATLEPTEVLPATTTGTTAGGPTVDEVLAVVAAWLTPKADTTRRGYLGDLDRYATWAAAPNWAAALAELWTLDTAGADDLMGAYLRDLQTPKTNPARPDDPPKALTSATVARRLATLRSVTRKARARGMVVPALDVEAPKVDSYGDTAGPGMPAVRAMLAALDPTTPTGARDRALIRTLAATGLRRGELVAADLADLDRDRGALMVTGKGRTTAAPVTVPAGALAALAAWIDHRGTEPGPLFIALDRAHHGHRLTGRSVANITARTGKAAGVTGTVRPHGLRHTAITAALDTSGGNVRAAAKFSRHAKLDTLNTYDDNRADLAGALAGGIVAQLGD